MPTVIADGWTTIMGILYGLIAALCWGLGDYLITRLTRHVGTPRALAYIQCLSLLAWIALLAAQPAMLAGSTSIWVWALAAGVCHVLGLLLTYRAFEIGTLSLVSPLASGFAIVTALLAWFSGERPEASALYGAGLLCMGVVMASYSSGAPEAIKRKSLAGVPEALGSALAFGIMFWMFDRVEKSLGFIWPLILLKAMAFSSVLLSLALQKGRTMAAETAVSAEVAPSTEPAPPASPGTLWALASGAAATDTMAWIAFNKGLGTEYTTIVTALASLFSVVTILLAWVLLRERLAPNQWAGVIVILLGILLVSFR